MKARVTSLPGRALIALAAGAVLVYALAFWFLLVSPKRAEVTTLAQDVVAAELRLVEARAAAARPVRVTGTRVGDVLHLAKAMPASTDQPGLVLELELAGRASGVKIGSIAPAEPLLIAGVPTSIPVVITAEGSYGQITRFLRRIRDLVGVRGGAVRARGRLLTVQALDLSESKARSFPRLDATLTVNAFVYDGPIAPVTAAPSADDSDDSSTGSSAARGTP